MSDPTIPELVARLREIDSEWGDNWTLCIGEAVGALHEDGDRLAEAVCELRNALPTLLDALDHVGDAAAHSPDGGKVGELDHAECSVSTGIDGALTAGQGELAPSGYWEHPCHECADRANASEVRRLQDIVDDLESRSTWRPMAEAPRDGNSFLAYWGSLALGRFGPVHFDGSRFVCQGSPGLPESRLLGWLPIPPADESEGE